MERSLRLVRWGLVPYWAKDPKGGARMINARSESAAEKPAFRRALAARRCLIPADGWYEWQRGEDHKQPYYTHYTDGRSLAMAGLWEYWKPKDDLDGEYPDGLVTAAVLRFEGQLSTYKSHLGPPHPRHRCLHPEPPPEGLVPSCSEAGVLGAVTGVMGTLQATEVLKEILGIGEGLAGRLLLWDALDMRFRTVRLRRDPGCALCGEGATIRDLSAHGPAQGAPTPLACSLA